MAKNNQIFGVGGDSTLNINVFKSLKALAGENESIFVILDDREDVWFDEISGKTPENLLKVPPYFYHNHNLNFRKDIDRLFFDLCRNFD